MNGKRVSAYLPASPGRQRKDPFATDSCARQMRVREDASATTTVLPPIGLCLVEQRAATPRAEAVAKETFLKAFSQTTLCQPGEDVVSSA